MRHLAMSLCVLVAIRQAGSAPGPAIAVPRGGPIVVDGKIEPDEWDGAETQRLADGTLVRLRRDGSSLFLGIAATQRGFSSVCIASRDDAVRVLHASAALGSVMFRRAGSGGWHTESTAFAYGMRNPTLTDEARAERREYLTNNGWVASTISMGGGLTQEFQIALDGLATPVRIAVSRFVMVDDQTNKVIRWPEALPSGDGCGNERLVQGYVPKDLTFEPRTWLTLTW
jgi:hypothetical protein